MFCKYCGNKVESENFCSHCGQRVDDLQETSSSSQKLFRFEIEVRSYPIEVEFDSDWTSHWDSSEDFFSHQYHGAGGSCVCLNPDADFDDLSLFVGLDTDIESQTVTIDTASDGTQILCTNGTSDQGWVFSYVIVCSSDVKVMGTDLESARESAIIGAKQLFMIYDRSADDYLGVAEINSRDLGEG